MIPKVYVKKCLLKKKKYKIVKLENFFEYDPTVILLELDDFRELGRRGIEVEVVM
tara:strand:- start:281 stop:445 length:165 start_codon:yes stop_codon:yes gene_type:complete